MFQILTRKLLATELDRAEDTPVNPTAMSKLLIHCMGNMSQAVFDQLLVIIKDIRTITDTAETSFFERLTSLKLADRFTALYRCLETGISAKGPKVSEDQIAQHSAELYPFFEMDPETDCRSTPAITLRNMGLRVFNRHLKNMYVVLSTPTPDFTEALRGTTTYLKFFNAIDTPQLTHHNSHFQGFMSHCLPVGYFGFCFEQISMAIDPTNRVNPAHIEVRKAVYSLMDTVMCSRSMPERIKDDLIRQFTHFQAYFLVANDKTNPEGVNAIRAELFPHLNIWSNHLEDLTRIGSRATFQLCFCLGLSGNKAPNKLAMKIIDKMTPPLIDNVEETLSYNTLQLRRILNMGIGNYCQLEGPTLLGGDTKTSASLETVELERILGHVRNIEDVICSTDTEDMTPNLLGYYIRFHELFPALFDLLSRDIRLATREIKLPKRTKQLELSAEQFALYSELLESIRTIANHSTVSSLFEGEVDRTQYYTGICLPQVSVNARTGKGTFLAFNRGLPYIHKTDDPSTEGMLNGLVRLTDLLQSSPHKEPPAVVASEDAAPTHKPTKKKSGAHKKKSSKKSKPKLLKPPKTMKTSHAIAHHSQDLSEEEDVSDSELKVEGKEEASDSILSFIELARALRVDLKIKDIKSLEAYEKDMTLSGSLGGPFFQKLTQTYKRGLTQCLGDHRSPKRGALTMMGIVRGDNVTHFNRDGLAYRSKFLECRAYEQGIDACLDTLESVAGNLRDPEKELTPASLAVIELVREFGDRYAQFLQATKELSKPQQAYFTPEKCTAIFNTLCRLRHVLTITIDSRDAAIRKREAIKSEKIAAAKARRRQDSASASGGPQETIDKKRYYRRPHPETIFTSKLQRSLRFIQVAVACLPEHEVA